MLFLISAYHSGVCRRECKLRESTNHNCHRLRYSPHGFCVFDSSSSFAFSSLLFSFFSSELVLSEPESVASESCSRARGLIHLTKNKRIRVRSSDSTLNGSIADTTGLGASAATVVVVSCVIEQRETNIVVVVAGVKGIG